MVNFFIANSCYFFSLSYLCINTGESKIKNKTTQYLIGELFAIVLFFLTSTTVSFQKTLVMTLFFLLYILIFFKFSVFKISFEILLTIIICAASELISNFIISSFIGTDYLHDINSFGYTIVTIISNLIMFIFVFFVTKIINGLKWNTYPKYIYLILILPLATATLFLNLNNYVEFIQNDIILVLCLIFLVASNFISIFTFVNIINAVNQINKINAKKEFYNLRYEYLSKLYNTNFNFMHHIIRKLMKIQNEFNKSNIENVKAELFSLNHSIIKNFNIINTRSDLVGPIINSYVEEFTSNNIEFVNTIENEDFSFLEIQDQHDLFDYILNISLFCCKASLYDKKLIVLKTEKRNMDAIIQVLYSKADIYQSNEFIEKYNLLSKVVQKYDGLVDLEKEYTEYISSILIIFSNIN